VRATTAHVRARRRSKEASNEAAAVGVDFHLLGRLASRLEGLLLFNVADVDVAVAQGGDGRWAARLVGEG
jgi:hypothetical protein